MKKLIFLIFFIIFSNLYSTEIRRDIDISNMPLAEVASILSKETKQNIIASQEAKNIIVDAYFEQGDDISTILYVLADAYNLNISKNSNTTIISSKKEERFHNSKLIVKVLDSTTNQPLPNVNLTLKDKVNFQSQTNKDGVLIIDNIPKAVYLAKFVKNGFETKAEIIDINKSTLSLDVYLTSLNDKTNDQTTKSNSHILSFFEKDGKLFYTENFNLFNINTEDMKKLLTESFGENIKISSLPKVNKLTVVAEKDVLESAKKIIKDLDKNPRQVKISSEILDISNNLFEELGFDWVYTENIPRENTRSSLSANILRTASAVTTGTIYGSQATILRQFNNKNDILDVSINMLEATNDLTISSMPTITIASGEEGEFKVTEEVIVGERSERVRNRDNNDNSLSSYSIEPVFKEAGLILKVKPLIKDNDEVTLDILIELSNFKFKKNLLNVSEVNSGTYNSEGGSKIGRALSTTVKVKNGDTILLGGLKKSIKQSTESKIPILGDIPLINFFFKNTSKRDENSDMYIKLKVEIENP